MAEASAAVGNSAHRKRQTAAQTRQWGTGQSVGCSRLCVGSPPSGGWKGGVQSAHAHASPPPALLLPLLVQETEVAADATVCRVLAAGQPHRQPGRQSASTCRCTQSAAFLCNLGGSCAPAASPGACELVTPQSCCAGMAWYVANWLLPLLVLSAGQQGWVVSTGAVSGSIQWAAALPPCSPEGCGGSQA